MIPLITVISQMWLGKSYTISNTPLHFSKSTWRCLTHILRDYVANPTWGNSLVAYTLYFIDVINQATFVAAEIVKRYRIHEELLLLLASVQ